MTRLARSLPIGIAMVLVAALTSSAEAQVGSLIRKAKGVLGKPAVQPPAAAGTGASTAASATSPGSPGTLDSTLLARFQVGIEAELVAWKAVLAKMPKVLSPDDYRSCQLKVYQSPEGQAWLTRYQNSKGDPKIIAELNEKQMAMMAGSCGPNPADVDPGAQRQAGAQAGSAGAAAAGFSAGAYALIKERVVPFCRANPGSKTTGDDVRLGTGGNHYLVYQGVEPDALRDACPRLMPTLSALP